MVWGCFSADGVGAIHRIEGIMDKEVYLDILTTVAIPSAITLRGSDFCFQQDNDPKHTAKIVTEFLTTPNEFFPPFEVMTWPSQSPDLNPIENLWEELDHQVRQRQTTKTSPAKFFEILKDCWDNISPAITQNLVNSMPRRVAAVIKNRGGPTKY